MKRAAGFAIFVGIFGSVLFVLPVALLGWAHGLLFGLSLTVGTAGLFWLIGFAGDLIEGEK